MKITRIIQENLPKGQWVGLDDEDLEKYKDEIFKMIDFAYKYVGGHATVKSPEDINMKNIEIWRGINLDDDPEPDAISMEKDKPAGRKFVGGATDGSSEAKREYLQSRIRWLRRSGYFVEASHKIADILAKAGVPIVKDPQRIKVVLGKSDVKMVDPENGFYERSIGGRKFVKRLFGRPK